MKRIVPLLLLAALASAAFLLWAKTPRPASRERQPSPDALTAQPIEPAPTALTAIPAPEPADDIALHFPPLPLDAGPLAWERQIEAIANRSDVPDLLKARLLIQMLPGLPEEALAQAAESATDLLADKDYAATALPTVLDPRTHGRAMSVLFADLMERPDAIALPALLAIARNPKHAFAPAARDNLQLLLGQDLGSEWAKWDAAIQRHLQPVPR